MTLGMEYLIRHRIVEDMVEYPLSLFLEGAERVALTFDRKGNTKLLVRRYLIDRTDTKAALPPCDEFVIKSSAMFSDPRIVIDGMHPISYVEEPVEASLNSPRRPIESEVYHYYALNLLNSGYHRSVKESWLWRAFYEIYMLPFTESKGAAWDELEEELVRMNAKDFARKDKYLWTHWLLWKRIIMPESMMKLTERGVAGELAFSPVYLDRYSARDASPSCSGLVSEHTSKSPSADPSAGTLSA
jgi:hypothetical protein